MNPPPTPTPKTRPLPKARVMWTDVHPHTLMYGPRSAILKPARESKFDTPFAVIPAPSLKRARAWVKLAGMTEEELADEISTWVALEITGAYLRGQYGKDVVTDKREDYVGARNIIRALGLAEGSKP